MPLALFEKHQSLLRRAVAATQSRRHWVPFAETHATAEQEHAAFDACRRAGFYLDQPGVMARGGREISPFGLPLDIAYPQCAPSVLMAAATAAMAAWNQAGSGPRAGVCLQVLTALAERRGVLGQALMHTTGNALPLARSQATHGLARALEALAVAWRELAAMAPDVRWERGLGAHGRTRARVRLAPRPLGVGLIQGAAHEPLLFALPALFANLLCGNAVVVRPHPDCVLPLALVVAECRNVLREVGFDPNLVALLVDDGGELPPREAALHADVRLIDVAGGRGVCDWLRANAGQAQVTCFASGSNCVLLESTDDYRGMLRHLATALCLDSGRGRWAPQIVLIPANGVATPEGRIDGERLSGDLAQLMAKLLEDPQRAAELLCVAGSGLRAEVERERAAGEPLRSGDVIAHPEWPQAWLQPPLLLRASPKAEAYFGTARETPVKFLVEVGTAAAGLALAERVMSRQGGYRLTLYSVNGNVLALAEDAAWRAGVALATNPVGSLAQATVQAMPAPFSDLVGGGGNPSAYAGLVDAGFVARRFFWAQVREGQV